MLDLPGGAGIFRAIDVAECFYGPDYYMTFAERSGFGLDMVTSAIAPGVNAKELKENPHELWKLFKKIIEAPN